MFGMSGIIVTLQKRKCSESESERLLLSKRRCKKSKGEFEAEKQTILSHSMCSGQDQNVNRPARKDRRILEGKV